MPQGLQAWTADGRLLIDTTLRTGRLFAKGRRTVGNTQTVSGMLASEASKWYVVATLEQPEGASYVEQFATVTINNGSFTVSNPSNWDWTYFVFKIG